MDKKSTIDNWSLGYWFIKNILTKPAHILYYRKVEIKNAGRIPDNQPVIIAPNHQNALMDAMVLVLRLKYQTIFLTRADIFKNPFIRKILIYLKMLPVYRIRDGRDNLQKNDEIFNVSVQVLLNKKNPLCIFPEGNHGEKRKLRPLVKGIFRIGFQAQEHFGNRPGVKIIPVGLDYEDYYKFGKNLFVNIGHPVEVADYWDDYVKEPAGTIKSLRDRLIEEMKTLMIHIETDEFYDLFMDLRTIYRSRMYVLLHIKEDTLSNRFHADKKLIEKLDSTLQKSPGKIQAIAEKYENYSELRDKIKLRDWVFRKPSYSVPGNLLKILFLLLLSPVFITGMMINAPVFFISPHYARKIKDAQMHSTFSWGISFVLGLIYYPALIIPGFIFLPAWWLKIIFPVLIPLSGLLAYKIRNSWIKSWAKIRYSLFKNRNKDIKKAFQLHLEIIQYFDELAA